MGRKVAYDDNWFLQNGYWKEKIEVSRPTEYNPTGGEKYTIMTPTEKWRKLMDTIFRNHDLHTIITPEVLIKTIETGTSRTKKDSKYYKKIQRPEGYLTIKQRKAKAKRLRDKRNDNRNT